VAKQENDDDSLITDKWVCKWAVHAIYREVARSKLISKSMCLTVRVNSNWSHKKTFYKILDEPGAVHKERILLLLTKQKSAVWLLSLCWVVTMAILWLSYLFPSVFAFVTPLSGTVLCCCVPVSLFGLSSSVQPSSCQLRSFVHVVHSPGMLSPMLLSTPMAILEHSFHEACLPCSMEHTFAWSVCLEYALVPQPPASFQSKDHISILFIFIYYMFN
jgi:hypothetical protein